AGQQRCRVAAGLDRPGAYRAGIVGLAAAFVVAAVAVADAAKIETYGGQTEFVGRTRQHGDDLVVLGAALLRMRVTDECETVPLFPRPADRGFDAPGRPLDQAPRRLSLFRPFKPHDPTPLDGLCPMRCRYPSVWTAPRPRPGLAAVRSKS